MRLLEMVDLLLIPLVCLVGGSVLRRSCVATLPDLSTLSALVCSDVRVLLSLVLGMSLGTTLLASIVHFLTRQ